jgi:hypothetical protein
MYSRRYFSQRQILQADIRDKHDTRMGQNAEIRRGTGNDEIRNSISEAEDKSFSCQAIPHTARHNINTSKGLLKYVQNCKNVLQQKLQ